jgi:photosystem II stability/assembly factor-like uncharacterized protein
MSDLNEMVAGVRTAAAKANWPEPAQVRARADRRTVGRRVAAAALVGAAVVAAAGIFATGGPARPTPAGPGVTTRLPLDSIEVAPSGVIFAITHTCAGGCSAITPPNRYSLLRSTDLARTWTTVGTLDGVTGGKYAVLDLAVASNDVLWIADGTAVLGSHDGGRHWTRWDPGPDPAGSKGGGIAGTTLWMAFNGQVLVATDGGQPGPTAAQPPGTGAITSVAALSPQSAIVARESGDGAGWYRTDDRGAHWSPATDPCAGLAHPNVTDAYMTAGRSGGLWTVCFVAKGAYPGWQIATSADGGHNWQPHPGDAPGGDDVSPVSATVAWRTGNGADVYRTTDAGAHWIDVAKMPAGSSIAGGFVLDANTALYVLPEPAIPNVTLHITTDGGRTWTTRPFGR